jgi:hypothetical protein
MSFGAHLLMSPVTTAAHLCTAVFDGDLQLLRRLLQAGATPNAADYDNRTALHIAAADGNLSAVRVVVSNKVNNCIDIDTNQILRFALFYLLIFQPSKGVSLLCREVYLVNCRYNIVFVGGIEVILVIYVYCSGEAVSGIWECKHAVTRSLASDTLGRSQECWGTSCYCLPAIEASR